MLTRHAGLVLALCTVVCRPSLAAEPAPAQVLWLKGQQAMRDGKTEQAIDFYRQSLKQDPGLISNELCLAAGYVALGQDAKAALHLGRYLDARADHVIVRGHYAELLLRLGRPREARAQYEHFIADIQGDPELAAKHLVHCHGRLTDIAEAAGDGYAEHLHRGISLYLLAVQRARLDLGEIGLCEEALLCQSAGELSLAQRECPDEARPCWYLHEVWARLAQTQPANRWLRATEAAAPFSYLSPHEKAGLQLACRRLACETSHK